MTEKRIPSMLTIDTRHLVNEKKIFDLRAEFAITAVKLGLVAERHDRILALSIDPDLPRYFTGNPRPFRKLFSRLVKIALLATDVDIVTVRLDNTGSDNNENCRLKLSVTANGPGITPATMHVLKQPTLFPPSQVDKNSHALLIVSKQIRRLGGRLRIASLHGWGTRYAINFQLSPYNSSQVYATAS